ncbi:3008_t:CDS:2 [Funneliformis geosporum]|uniref:Protein YOP1 n=1 Tax=Funneliformis geosporum TaxID=1117311 RepID=A0A9W4SKD9_9GLOM|nr:3008_t:CDS:2 [Funneliformis geosporum]CAI2172588.1 6050_t:CDS:2 [Funneliformis geosporum]
MDSIQVKLKYYNALADKELSKYEQVNKLEKYTNVPKTYMAAGAVGVVFLLIFFNFWGQLLSNVIGWLYPDTILYWMPFYYLFKTVFFLWLFLPPFKGAQVIYSKFLRQVLLNYQNDVDKNLSKLHNKISEATKDIVKEAIDVGTAIKTE